MEGMRLISEFLFSGGGGGGGCQIFDFFLTSFQYHFTHFTDFLTARLEMKKLNLSLEY